MSFAYYNEFNREAAAWLTELIKVGVIAPGLVDTRSIEDVRPSDLRGFTQCHFFAGIGVWSYALRCAGWPDDRRVWTGSCPCQPFSQAGEGLGFDDERHLWPTWFQLIAQCRPDVVFGEQVASKDGLAWLDLVQSDMEGAAYAFAPVDLCAAGVGAPHIRQRLWFVADSDSSRLARFAGLQAGRHGEAGTDFGGGAGLVGHSDVHHGAGRASEANGVGSLQPHRPGDAGGLADHGSEGRRQVGADAGGGDQGGRAQGLDERPVHGGTVGEPCGLADAHGRHAGAEGLQRGGEHGQQSQDGGSVLPADAERQRLQARPEGDVRGALGHYEGRLVGQSGLGGLSGPWADADWIYCRDGKWRPVEPGTFPLAHGAPARVGRLRGYGNAIVAPVAQTFIEAYIEVAGEVA